MRVASDERRSRVASRDEPPEARAHAKSRPTNRLSNRTRARDATRKSDGPHLNERRRRSNSNR